MKAQKFDVSQYLNTPDDIQEYLKVALEENGVEGFPRALGHVAKAKGITAIAENANVDRGSLYKLLSDSELQHNDILCRVLESFGVQPPVEVVCKK